MKTIKIILLAFIVSAAAISAKAQTIDTAFHKVKAVKITAFKATFNDAKSVNRLAITSVSDNLVSSVTIQWVLCDDTTAKAFWLTGTMSGTATMSGTDYNAWQGDDDTLFKYLGKTLSLTFIK